VRTPRPARTALAIVVALVTTVAGSARASAQTADRFLGR
jgi:hypothetical protein